MNLNQFVRHERKQNHQKLKKMTPVEVPVNLKQMKESLKQSRAWNGYVGEDMWYIVKADSYNELVLHSPNFLLKATDAEGQVGYDNRLGAFVAMWRTAG